MSAITKEQLMALISENTEVFTQVLMENINIELEKVGDYHGEGVRGVVTFSGVEIAENYVSV